MCQCRLLVISLHTYLTKITRVKLIHQDSVVVLATSVTTSTRVASMLSDTAVSSGLVASLLSVVMSTGRHLSIFPLKKVPNYSSTQSKQIATHNAVPHDRKPHTRNRRREKLS